MRVTNSSFYQGSTNDYQRAMQDLNKVNNQIATGLKIKNSFEDSDIYSNTMRLNHEIAILEQIQESSIKAQTHANNADSVLGEFTKLLEKFKTKLLQAASDSNSSMGLDAIANELSSLRDQMINLGNTSINGKYLFSGTAFESKPLDSNGNYRGNDGVLEAIIGSGMKLPYNINGQDLFLGKDSHINKVLSTNAKMFNQAKLHPDILSDGNELPEEVYINENDTIRDLVGDTDSDTTNDPNSVFYLSGRKSDGTTFSSELEISSSSKISDLLDKIGQEYGNTTTNKVVEVSMNEHGQIEIKDLKDGNSLLEMNLFGAVDREAASGTVGNASQADIDDLVAQKNVDIISFNQSNFSSVNSADTVGVKSNPYNPKDFSLNSVFQHLDGTDVASTDTLRDLMGNSVNQIVLNGTHVDGTAVSINLPVTATTTVQDLMDEIDNTFGVTSRLEKGQIYIADNTLGSDAIYGSSQFDLTLNSQDAAGLNVNGFSTPDSMNYERRGFDKDGNTLSSNVSHMIKDTGLFATGSTKLSEVAGVSLDGEQFLLSGIDNSGNSFDVQIDFGNPTTTFSLDGGTTNYTIFDGAGGATAGNQITYRQLSDVISMVTSGNIPATNTFSDYENSLSSSKSQVEVGLDHRGRLEIKDKFNSVSPIEFSIFDANADSANNASALSFMANDSVKIQDPHVNLFEDLDNIIEAVRFGLFRMNGDSDNPRNIGIQNSLNKIDQLSSHVIREHAKIGSYSNSLSQVHERSEMLSINVTVTRSEVVEVDMGEALMKFSQLSNSYQAMLSTVAKINSMSLLNYM
ncbi:MAG: flagellar hook-associated protein FlgL [Sulfurospirillum sp.]|nr:flagellar hook-associated protein FlgL [Sulfurospirillum sp.]